MAETAIQAADRANAEADRSATEANLSDRAKELARAHAATAVASAGRAETFAIETRDSATQVGAAVTELTNGNFAASVTNATAAADRATAAAAEAKAAAEAIGSGGPVVAAPLGSYMGYQPTLLNSPLPLMGKRFVYKGDSSGVPNGDYGTPKAKIFGSIVSKRFGVDVADADLQHVGGSTAPDVALRMLAPNHPQYQDISNPAAVLPANAVSVVVGGNDAGMGGGLATGRTSFADGIETIAGLLQSTESRRSGWIKTGTWSTLVWATTRENPIYGGTAQVSSTAGDKIAAQFTMDVGRAATLVLLANADSTGANYTATIRRFDEPASAAIVVKSDTTINHGFGGDATILKAPYSPVPVTFTDRAGVYPVGTNMLIEITNTGGGPLIVDSVHPWGLSPEIRFAPAIYQRAEAWKLLRPEPEYAAYVQSNAIIDSYYRPTLVAIVAALGNPKIKVGRPRLFDTLVSWLEEGLRVADKLHFNEVGQQRFAQAIYESFVGTPEGVDPELMAFATLPQLHAQAAEIERRALASEVAAEITRLNASVAERALSSEVATQLSILNTAIGLRPTQADLEQQFANTVSVGPDGKIPSSALPPVTVVDTTPVASEAAMLALNADKGDIAIRTDLRATFILSAVPPTTRANWLEIVSPLDGVLTVNGRSGPAVSGLVEQTDYDAHVSTSATAGAARDTAIGLRELLSNKSTDVALGGATPSAVLYPAQSAVSAALAAVANRTPPGRNWVQNGRAEFGTLGYLLTNAATISSSSNYAYVGTNSIRVALGTAATNNGVRILGGTLMPKNTVVRVSVRVYLPAAQAPTSVNILASPGGLISAGTSLTDQWVQLRGTATTDASGSLSLFVIAPGSTSGQTFYLDDVIVTEGDYYSGYTYAPEDFVNLAATQSIGGAKTFTGATTFSGAVSFSVATTQSQVPRFAFLTATANTVLTATSPPIVFCNNSTDITVQLPSNASSLPMRFEIARTGTGMVTILPPSGGTITAMSAGYVLTMGNSTAIMVSTGTTGAWIRMGGV